MNSSQWFLDKIIQLQTYGLKLFKVFGVTISMFSKVFEEDAPRSLENMLKKLSPSFILSPWSETALFEG